MGFGFYLTLIYLLHFKLFAATPVVIQSAQLQNPLTTSESFFINKLISTYDYIQLGALFVLFLLVMFGGLMGLKLTIYRRYFWKKESNEDLDFSNSKYKPVVCIHGLLDSARDLGFFADVIQKNHLGTIVEVLDVFNNLYSLKPLWEQIELIKTKIEDICKEHPEGINLVGVSQGAVLARGVLETSDKHNVDTFISIAGPQMGQFGVPLINACPGTSCFVKNFFRCAYTSCCQKLSVPEIWKDPYHLSHYEEKCIFLPKLNNEIKHPDSERFKTNFSRLKHLVLIGGPNDGFVIPWQSSHFGYFDEHGKIVEMKDQNIYKNDTFGLRTLDEKNAVTIYSIPHTAHYFYVYSVPLIKQYILPHLN